MGLYSQPSRSCSRHKTNLPRATRVALRFPDYRILARRKYFFVREIRSCARNNPVGGLLVPISAALTSKGRRTYKSDLYNTVFRSNVDL
eukprot:490284-Pyramimonas_sp.AAC.1